MIFSISQNVKTSKSENKQVDLSISQHAKASKSDPHSLNPILHLALFSYNGAKVYQIWQLLIDISQDAKKRKNNLRQSPLPMRSCM